MDGVEQTRTAKGHDAKSDRSGEGGWRELESEHETLAAAAARLDEELGRLAAQGAEVAAGPEAEALAEAFRGRLLAHLESEERSGILERAAAREPRLDRRVQALCEQHAELRERVDGLVAEAAASTPRLLHERFVAFRRFLGAHERAENDVLHRAYLEDLGGHN